MKLSNPLSLILMAAASNDVSGSSSKSGKGRARLATGIDYAWVLGRYTKCQYTAITLRDGEPRQPSSASDLECDDKLVIERLGDDQNGVTFQATFLKTGDIRRIFEGVGSYNRRYSDEITFYNDHAEVFNGTSWVPLPGEQASDVSTMRVSQLDGDCSSVVADVYANAQVGNAFQFEIIATFLYTDDDSE